MSKGVNINEELECTCLRYHKDIFFNDCRDCYN